MDISGSPAGFSDWSELSLSSDGDEIRRPDLYFRRNRSATPERVYEIGKQDLQTDDEKATAAASSSAYFYGMMLVHGAAKVVNNVAGSVVRGDNPNIRELQTDLDETREKYELLQDELRTTKQRAYHYENLKEALEIRLNENKKFFQAQVHILEGEIKKAGAEAETCRGNAADAGGLRERLTAETAEAKRTIENLQKQLEDVRSRTVEKDEASSSANVTVSMATAASQTEAAGSAEDSESAKLRRSEEELRGAREGLKAARLRQDKMRERLTLSVDLMRKQTDDMKSYRVALESSLNKADLVKKMLQVESAKSETLDRRLREERKARWSAERELEEKKKSDLEVSGAKRSEFKRQSALARNKMARKHHRALLELFAGQLAGTIATTAIEQAVRSQLVSEGQEKMESLQRRAYEKEESLKMGMRSKVELEDQVVALRSDVKRVESERERCQAQVDRLLAEVEQLKSDSETKGEVAGNLKRLLDQSDARLRQSCSKHQTEVDGKRSEIARLTSHIEELQRMNSRLNQKLIQRGQKSSVGVQTSAVDRSVDEQTQIPHLDRSLVEPGIAVHVEKSNDEVEALRAENKRLQQALNDGRSLLIGKNREISNVREEWRRSDWHWRWQCEETLRLKRNCQYLRRCVAWYENYFYGATGRNTQQQSPAYRGNVYGQKNVSGKPLESISEVEEQQTPVASLPSVAPAQPEANSSPAARFNIGGNSGDYRQNTEGRSSANDSSEDLNREPSTSAVPPISEVKRNTKQKLKKVKNPASVNLLESHDSNSVSSSSELAERSVYSPGQSSSHLLSRSQKRLAGVPMPENVYERILASEYMPSWKGDIFLSPDDGYSSSGNSISEESTPKSKANTDFADSVFSAGTSVESSPRENHYFATYKGIQFDLAHLTLTSLRTIACSSGAIATQRRMNDFYQFIADKVDEMNRDPYWKGNHALGCPEDWLGLKRDA